MEGLNVLQTPARCARMSPSASSSTSRSTSTPTATTSPSGTSTGSSRSEAERVHDPSSYFNVYEQLGDEEAVSRAMGFWNDINLPNLHGECAADQAPGDARAAQGRRPQGEPRAAAQAVEPRGRPRVRPSTSEAGRPAPTPYHRDSTRPLKPGAPSSAPSSSVSPHRRASPRACSRSVTRIPSARGVRSGGGGPSPTAGS